ncbi:MAG: hypothetical protein K2K83_03630 [Rikenella sp.]|nr:hypothetical protein [Rikenella sp.]
MEQLRQLEQFRTRWRSLTFSDVRRMVKSDAAFRQEVEALYVSTFHRPLNKRCSDCWLDAFVLLRRTPTDELMAIRNRQFELRYGALLIDVVDHDDRKMVSAHNLTDELALYHLRTNPRCIDKFTKYPANWKKLAARSGRKSAGAEGEPTAAEMKSDE